MCHNVAAHTAVSIFENGECNVLQKSEQLQTVARLNLERPSYVTEMDHETLSPKVCCLHIFFLPVFHRPKVQRRNVATGSTSPGHCLCIRIYKHTENAVNF